MFAVCKTIDVELDYNKKTSYTEMACFFALTIVLDKVFVGTYQIGDIFLCRCWFVCFVHLQAKAS